MAQLAVPGRVGSNRVALQELASKGIARNALRAGETAVVLQCRPDFGMPGQRVITMPRQPDYRPQRAHGGVVRPWVEDNLVRPEIDVI